MKLLCRMSLFFFLSFFLLLCPDRVPRESQASLTCKGSVLRKTQMTKSDFSVGFQHYSSGRDLKSQVGSGIYLFIIFFSKQKCNDYCKQLQPHACGTCEAGILTATTPVRSRYLQTTPRLCLCISCRQIGKISR